MTIETHKDYIELTVASGQTNGAGVNVSSFRKQGRLAGIAFECPAAIDGTAATIQVSADGSNWKTIKDIDGNDKSVVTISAGSYHYLDPVVFGRLPDYLRVVNGTQATAARTYKFYFREV